jgi:hypothetical protein
MTANVYRQQKSQSASGQIIREWVFLETINCRTMPNRKTSNAEQWGSEYRYDQSLTLKTLFDVSPDDKISEIKDSEGLVLYPDTIFEVSEIVALVDGFGVLFERELTLKRSEVQSFE